MQGKAVVLFWHYWILFFILLLIISFIDHSHTSGNPFSNPDNSYDLCKIAKSCPYFELAPHIQGLRVVRFNAFKYSINFFLHSQVCYSNSPKWMSIKLAAPLEDCACVAEEHLIFLIFLTCLGIILIFVGNGKMCFY